MTAAASRRPDRGNILPLTMVVVVVFTMLGMGIARYAAVAERSASVTRQNLQRLGAAEGAMRLALEMVRSPDTVVQGNTSLGSATVTSASGPFQSTDLGATIEAATIPAGSTIVAVVSATTVTISTPATASATNTLISYGDAGCTTTPSTVLSTSIGGQTASVTCVREPTIPGQFGAPAVVITGLDGLELKEDSNIISGDLYFTTATSITLGKKLVVEDGDVWYPSTTCPGTPPSITNLSFAHPGEHGYVCVDTDASDHLSDLLSLPALGTAPGAAPASTMVGTCRVFSPGRYTTSNKPDLDGTKDVYFKSGTYYFENLGEVKIHDTRITGGRPGDALAADDSEALWNPACEAAAATVGDTGKGATIVLGGTSRLTIQDKGGLELYAPNSGFSVVAFALPTDGFLATTGGTAADPLIDQRAGGSMLRLHGTVWMPSGYLSLGAQTPAAWTLDGAAATGGQLLGGVVAKRLEVTKKAPPEGYNVQSERTDLVERLLLVSTSGRTSVRVVADLRPSGEELAIRSWQVSDDASVPTPSAPKLVSTPSLSDASDTGTRDQVLTKLTTPTLEGTAAANADVRLYVDGVVKGHGVAVGGTYSITTSALTAGDHEVYATARNASGTETQSLHARFTVDLTPPVMAASDVAIAAVGHDGPTGTIAAGSQFYVYANAVDSNGVPSIVADVSNLTTGLVTVPLRTGSYSVGGTVYAWRSPPLTARSDLAAGTTTFSATPIDAAGNIGVATAATVAIENTPPSIVVSSPLPGAALAAPHALTVTATDVQSGVDRVVWEYAPTGTGTWTTIATTTTAPFGATWDTTVLPVGTYDVRVTATDGAGNTASTTVMGLLRAGP
jgi:Tfp pilus assembly protein PilX